MLKRVCDPLDSSKGLVAWGMAGWRNACKQRDISRNNKPVEEEEEEEKWPNLLTLFHISTHHNQTRLDDSNIVWNADVQRHHCPLTTTTRHQARENEIKLGCQIGLDPIWH